MAVCGVGIGILVTPAGYLLLLLGFLCVLIGPFFVAMTSGVRLRRPNVKAKDRTFLNYVWDSTDPSRPSTDHPSHLSQRQGGAGSPQAKTNASETLSRRPGDS